MQQYKIVHNDTSDLHQHSVNSKWCHNSQRTPPRGWPSHTIPRPTKPCTDTACDKQKTESRIIEYDTWLQTQFPELLMISKWCLKHVENYHQIKSIKSCISSVIYMIINGINFLSLCNKVNLFRLTTWSRFLLRKLATNQPVTEFYSFYRIQSLLLRYHMNPICALISLPSNVFYNQTDMYSYISWMVPWSFLRFYLHVFLCMYWSQHVHTSKCSEDGGFAKDKRKHM